MQLTLAHHPITDFQFGAPARLDGTALIVNPAELRSLLLEDDSIVSIDFDIVLPRTIKIARLELENGDVLVEIE